MNGFNSYNVVEVAGLIERGREYSAGERAKVLAGDGAHELIEAAGRVLAGKVYRDNPGVLAVLISRAKDSADNLDAQAAACIRELGY